MSYTHLSITERSKLEILHQQGKSARAIAKDMPPLAGNCAETQPNRLTMRGHLRRAMSSVVRPPFPQEVDTGAS
nr:helix-turn-helix domain-containing protein [Paenibacillus popilliae]